MDTRYFQTTRNETLYEIGNDNGVTVINFT